MTVLGGAPSNATAVDKGHYFSEPYSFAYDDCGFDAEVEGTANAVFNETKARRVEGNIFEFQAVEAGELWLFDTEGDDVPGGIFLENLGTDVRGPHPGFDDFCGFVTRLIGPSRRATRSDPPSLGGSRRLAVTTTDRAGICGQDR